MGRYDKEGEALGGVKCWLHELLYTLLLVAIIQCSTMPHHAPCHIGLIDSPSGYICVCRAECIATYQILSTHGYSSLAPLFWPIGVVARGARIFPAGVIYGASERASKRACGIARSLLEHRVSCLPRLLKASGPKKWQRVCNHSIYVAADS